MGAVTTTAPRPSFRCVTGASQARAAFYRRMRHPAARPGTTQKVDRYIWGHPLEPRRTGKGYPQQLEPLERGGTQGRAEHPRAGLRSLTAVITIP